MTDRELADALTIAIDGPSGSGKSSVSRAVAQHVGVGYLDTGAMYRALTWRCVESRVDLSDGDLVAHVARQFSLRLSNDPRDPSVEVDGIDVTSAIRTSRISGLVSQVAGHLQVRPILQRLQREQMLQIAARTGGVVAEGRDITTIVAPDAKVRLLLTASEEARLRRRSAELHGNVSTAALEATRDEVVRRDAIDAAVAEFTVAADGVVTIDTSNLDFEESVAAVLTVVREAGGLEEDGGHEPPH